MEAPEPKRRRRGGMRQRLARQQLEDGSQPESALATLLVTLFAWGVFSPQRVQEIAHLAI